MSDKDLMKLALALAAKGEGLTSPNPLVGAVIVKDGEVIGQGYHEKCGGPHAEREALASCQRDPRGGTIYVTLEPCCHVGRTPPCTEAIIAAGLKRVVIGTLDPNPLVAGKGVKVLRDNDIEVEVGVLEEECLEQNAVFFHYIQTGRPYLVAKYAMTLDGKIATYAGASRWITGVEARQDVHRDRHRYAGIMVGVGTVLTDDPALTSRLPGGKSPTRIICDTNLRTPTSAQVVTTADEVATIIATSCTIGKRQQPYLDAGCGIIEVPVGAEGHLAFPAVIAELGRLRIDSVYLEGGATLNWAALNSGLVNKVKCYLAPKVFGGAGAKTPVGGPGVEFPSDAFTFEHSKISRLGKDLLIESEAEPCLRV